MFRQAPGFAFASLLVLGLGMGATTALFSVFDAVLLKPLPFRQPDRLLVIWEKNQSLNRARMFVAPVNYREWRRDSRTLESVAATYSARINLTAGPAGRLEPEELKTERVSASLFPLLGVQPVLGRTFQEEEDQPSKATSAILSYRLWQRRFAGDRSIAGKSLVLGNRSYTVAGVMPAGFSILDPDTDLWLPLGLNIDEPRTGAGRRLAVIARLAPGASIDTAKSELDAIGARLEQTNPATNRGWRPSVFPLLDELVSKSVRRALEVLMAAVGLLLLLACANIANLLLVRGASRRKDLAVRTAMGAGRLRIVTQLSVESGVLAAAGGLLGLAIAAGGLKLLASLGTGSIPRLAGARLDGRLFLFAFLASALAGILFGILPAIQVSGSNLNTALAESPRGGTMSRSARMLRNILVAFQLAVAVVVLTGSGLLVRSFLRLRSADPGFRPEGVLTFRLPIAGGRNAAPERRAAFYNEVSDRIATLPGVRSAGVTNVLPLTGLGGGSIFFIEGRPLPPPEDRPVGLVRFVNGSYFPTMGIPLLAGRLFSAADRADAPPVILVNQTLARRFWPGGSALGGKINVSVANAPVGEIVGVVGDVKSEKMEAEDWPTIYYPYTQTAPASAAFVVRASVPPMQLARAVSREVQQLDRDQPLAEVRTLEEIVYQATAGSRFNTVVLGVFATLAFVLAAVGIYGVISYDVSRRVHEIGIRLALGAEEADVLKLILGQGARLAAIGISLGLVAAFSLTRLMASLLFAVRPDDAWTFAAISLLLAVVALAASYVPARRAASLDPLEALRHE
jgi:putative ABC transport system permease protein